MLRESAADTLEQVIEEARRRGPGNAERDEAPRAPSGPQLRTPATPKKRGGFSPWLVIGAAVAAGFVAAKVIDWRANANARH